MQWYMEYSSRMLKPCKIQCQFNVRTQSDHAMNIPTFTCYMCTGSNIWFYILLCSYGLHKGTAKYNVIAMWSKMTVRPGFPPQGQNQSIWHQAMISKANIWQANHLAWHIYSHANFWNFFLSILPASQHITLSIDLHECVWPKYIMIWLFIGFIISSWKQKLWQVRKIIPNGGKQWMVLPWINTGKLHARRLKLFRKWEPGMSLIACRAWMWSIPLGLSN